MRGNAYWVGVLLGVWYFSQAHAQLSPPSTAISTAVEGVSPSPAALASPSVNPLSALPSETVPASVGPATIKDESRDGATASGVVIQEKPPAEEGQYSGEWRGSLFFSRSDMDILRQALAAARLPKQAEPVADAQGDYLSQIENTAPAPDAPKEPFPAFFLSSVIYYNAADWSFSMNGQRFSAHDAVDAAAAVKVKNVEKSYIRMEWTPSREMMFRILAEHGDNSQAQAASSEAKIEINKERNAIAFTLKPGQSFEAATLRVVEGRSSPTLGESKEEADDLGALLDGKAPAGAAGVVGTAGAGRPVPLPSSRTPQSAPPPSSVNKP